MKEIQYESLSPEKTLKLGRLLGNLAQPGDIFLLVGDLGSGKTYLTQGIADGLNITANVISPTFVLVREYHGRLPLYHIDLYRLDNIVEISDLGLDEYFSGNGLTVIEWADKGRPVLPGENLRIEISYIKETERKFKLRGSGKRYSELISNIGREL